MDANAIFQRFMPLVGQWGGDIWNVYRPDYTAMDQTPTLIQSNVRFRCDPAGYKFAEPQFLGVSYYDVFGPESILLPGDILKRSSSDGMTPAITVAHFMPVKAITGVRTSRIGKIMNSTGDTPVYTSVYFDFLGIGFPGSSINRNLEESLRIPSTRAVLYPRKGISRLRMHLVETDNDTFITQPDGSITTFQRKWMIEEIDFSGTQMVLTLRNA